MRDQLAVPGADRREMSPTRNALAVVAACLARETFNGCATPSGISLVGSG
ncbi:MAG: hypothetical protein M0T85_10030 [Dehalococcoidales bacterium]|nr:hypothetical protein [Dehalococcoidales bacterium]